MIFTFLFLIAGPIPAIDPKIEECRKMLLLSYQKLDEVDELLKAFQKKVEEMQTKQEERRKFRLCR